MSASDENVLSLPQVTIQHDFNSVIDDVQEGRIYGEDFWISCYSQGRTSVHGKTSVSRNADDEVSIVPKGGFGIEKIGDVGVNYPIFCANFNSSLDLFDCYS